MYYNHLRKYLTTAQDNQDRVYVYFRALMLEWDGVMSTDSVEVSLMAFEAPCPNAYFKAHIYIKWLRELEQAVAIEKKWPSTPNIMGLIQILNHNLYESTVNRDTYMSILNQVRLRALDVAND